MEARTPTKQRIERAALRLFTEQGVAETSIRDIAQEAGVSQGAMYNHYASKEELASALFLDNFAKMGEELRHTAHAEPVFDAKIHAMVRCVFEGFDRDWILVTYVYMARHQYIRKISGRLINNPHLVFRTVIVDAMANGEIPRQDPDIATAMVMGAIIQVMDVAILGRIRQPRLADIADRVAEACIGLLRR